MSRPPLQQPDPVTQRLHREAEEAWADQDYKKSLALMEKAIRKDPHNPDVYLRLARGYGCRYDFPAVQRYIDKALKVSTNRTQTLEDAGRTCLEFNNIDMAIGYFERACQKINTNVGVGGLIELAEIYLRDKRTEEGAALVERAAQIDQKDSRVLFQQAVLARSRGKTEEAEPLLRELMNNPASDASVRIRAGYELAGILDGSGRYDEAMTTLMESKALLRPHAGPHAAALQHMQGRAKEMEQTITTAVLDRWRADLPRLHPPRRIALLCGHPRSGTTLLEQVLDAHSNVVSAEETRLMHDEAYLPLIRDFPEGTSILDALDKIPLDVVNRARENYFRCAELLLGNKIGDRLLLDKNPALNLMIPIVVRVFPETKFLIALRDPRDVVISCFMQALPPTPVSSAYHTLEGTVNQYANVMGFWLEMVPRMAGQWMYVRYEEMISDLPAVAKSTLGFLGLGFEEKVLNFHEHARAKRVISPSRDDVRKPLYGTAVGRWRNYEKYLAPYTAILDRFVKAFNYS